MSDNFRDKIIDRIDEEKIKPLPRWRFALLRSSFWLLAALSIILGAVAFATIIFLFVSDRAHGLLTMSEDLGELLLLIPYIWLLVFALFIITTHFSLKHTKKGYKYRLRDIILVSALLSVALGVLLYMSDLGEISHEFWNRVPLYNSSIHDSQEIWDRPVVGRLAGVVVYIQDDNNFSVVDFGGHLWRVSLATSTDNVFVPEANSTVRMTGMMDPHYGLFIANSVVEWEDGSY